MATPPALRLDRVSVRYEGQSHPTIEDVSLTLDAGRIAILIGPNGSGKSTLLRAILGLVPFEGSITVFGKPVREAYRDLGYVPQRLPFDVTLPLTVREAVRMPLLGTRGGDVEAVFDHFSDVLGIRGFLDAPLSSLSGGQLKRALIARAMVTSPRLLLLDEPEAEVDVGGERTLYELLGQMSEEHHITVLICSHELELVYRYADLVFCLNRRLQCAGPPEQVLTAESLAALYGPATTVYRHVHGAGAP